MDDLIERQVFLGDEIPRQQLVAHVPIPSLPVVVTGSSINTRGIGWTFPVCSNVRTSNPSSWVLKPPGNSAHASASITKNIFRVKKNRNVMDFGSSYITTDGLSKGRRMLTPKLFSGPAPSIPAFMMPDAAPVIAMKPASAI